MTPESYQFRLFAKPHVQRLGLVADTQRIIVRSPPPEDRESGFVTSRRPSSYYFTGEPDEKVMAAYQEVALSSGAVLAGARRRWVRLFACLI